MAIVDIVCAAVLIAMGIFGIVKGFARQILSLLSSIVALVGAFFLLKYVFDFLWRFDFFRAWVEGLGAKITVNVPFLAPIAEERGVEQGLLISEYIFKAVIFIAIAIVIGIIFKILKKIIKIIVSLPGLNIIDRILGLALGLFWGLAALFVVFFVMSLLSGSIAQVSDFMASAIPEECLTRKYLIANLDLIKEYVIYAFNYVIGLASSVIN